MKVLIIEDDIYKLAQVKDFITSKYHNSSIITAMSVHAGHTKLTHELYDIIILDMSLPTYDYSIDEPEGGFPQSFGGLEILQQMDRNNINIPVIIFTGFDLFGEGEKKTTLSQLKDELQSEHPNNYCGTVYYDATVDSWKADLTNFIDAIIAGGIDND